MFIPQIKLASLLVVMAPVFPEMQINTCHCIDMFGDQLVTIDIDNWYDQVHNIQWYQFPFIQQFQKHIDIHRN